MYQKITTATLTILFAILYSIPAQAAGAGAPHLDGGEMALIWAVPFAGILLSIAIFPLVAEDFWHHHFGKISAAWALAFMIPFTLQFGWELALFETLHVFFLEYLPFIILLFALFTVAGGVRVRGKLQGTPIVNTTFLLIGTVIASWMGTTGAAMLLIRPLIRANEWRTHKVHVIVFFIFLVANIGGSLTPLGDPPLFLGFLKGVSFFWPTSHMLAPMALVSVILLAVFFLLDSYYYKKEGSLPDLNELHKDEPDGIKIEGGINILLLGGVVAAVLMSGIWKPGIEFTVFHVHVELQNVLRDLALIGLALLSLKLTSRSSRVANGFSWFPILEVGKLFAGIFITIIPAIAILKAGTSGALEPVVSAVTSESGEPVNYMYFWLTGILSSFLDNAPTYLVFFNTAGGDAGHLMGPLANTLLAISAGAVFMGANTYIGNAPNFMVRSIAEERGISMPSFFGYMVWSCIFLVPCFVLITFVFF
ncbi:sodium:proton antiporter [Aestuariispira insulae]|uniref:UIT6 family transporter n=1 Tax=Aestuariispira insulae TaxID=1461337 RepID=A0A3D9HND7_9PROT|nr:sodium:proton antiporter [Aestuariispira insulae]RED50978.1 UIT6 family transporter [Aestuariispira insulae]